MTRDEIVKMAREAGFDPHDMSDDFTCNLMDIERFAAFVAAAEREKLAAWMIKHSFATGHGDTVEDLLKELEWQIEERVRNEREWVGLTDEEMEALFLNQDDVRFARYIESRLKDKNA